MQVVAVMTPALHLPGWVDSFFAVVLIIGFPVAMLLAWAFEMTPEGVKRAESVKDGDSIADKTGRKLDYTIICGLLLVGVLVVGNRLMPQQMAVPDTSVLAEPEAIVETAKTDEKPSIAVMPFEDFSSTKDQEYFANGISEELLNVLARISGLRVSSRTSSFAFKERNASTGEIAEALNVQHVLEGSIRKSGTTLRITAQLIDTASDEHMWSETYDRPLSAENIFAVQDEIAAAIVAELKGRLSLGITDQTERTASLEAYELYIRARDQAQKRLPDTLNVAITGYKQVIALDPDFAPAYAGLAVTYLLMDEYTNMSQEEGIRLAKPFVARALEQAPNSAEALTAAASLALEENKLQVALDFTKRAIAANPNYVLAYHRQGLALGGLGQPEKALASFEKALELDPLSAVLLGNVGAYQHRLRDIAAARATNEKNIKYNPDSIHGYTMLARIKIDNGDYAGAHTLLMDALALNPESKAAQGALANIYFAVGMDGEVSKVSKQPDDLALVLFLSGQQQEALRLAHDNPDNVGMSFALFASGDVKGAYPGFRKFGTDSKMVENKVIPVFVISYSFLAYIFKENGDADADLLVDKLERYFGKEKAVGDYYSGDDLQAGILLQLIKGDEDTANVWMDRFLGLGFTDELFFATPPFDDLRGTPEFAKREVRMKQNAAKHRAEIEAQRANPKSNWVKVVP